MPYLTNESKKVVNQTETARTAGELNYRITMLLIDYLITNRESYQTYNDMMGALEGAKLELYRRKIVPYEESKISDNGDVYFNTEAYK